MSTTATTPSELFVSIDSTIRNQTTPNSITPESHSDLLYNIVEVLSADTYTTSGIYDATASTINFTTSNTGVTYSVSGITDNNTYTTGGTYVASASTITFEDNQGGGYVVTGINEMQYLEVDVPVGVAATSGILGMGTVPIVLLAAPGAGMYNDVSKIIIEKTKNTTEYTFAVNDFPIINWLNSFHSLRTLTAFGDGISIITPSASETVNDGSSNYPAFDFSPLNKDITLTTWSSDPTLGDGTLKAKIWYTVRTFG